MERSLKREIVFILAFGCYALITVPVFWKSNDITGFLLITGSAGLFLYRPETRNIMIFTGAGLLGFSVEYLLTAKINYWNYANPSVVHIPGLFTVSTLPWWLFFAWGYIVLLFTHVSYALEKALKACSSGRVTFVSRLGTALIWVIMISYFSFVFMELDFRLTRWFLLIIIPFVLFWRRNIDMIAFFAGALLGTFGEWVCMQSGTWVYTLPYFKKAGIPLSLPLAWGLVTVLLRRFSLLFGPERGGR